jgi:hypothetical protein
VIVSYAALRSAMKDGSGTLGESLGIDPSVHPVAALNADAQALADCFGVDLFIVTAMVDAVNDALADNGSRRLHAERVSDRIKSGELKRYLGSAGTRRIHSATLPMTRPCAFCRAGGKAHEPFLNL